MDDDWDLHAVVRGCAAAVTTNTAATATNDDPFPSFSYMPFGHDGDDQNSFDFTDLVDDRNDDAFQGLRQIYQEFCVDAPPPPAAAAAAADISVPSPSFFQSHQEIAQTKPPLQMMNMQIQENTQFNNNSTNHRINGSSSHNFPAATNPQPIRPRRRKNQQMKMVREMTQEELSADSWAWRKYGQKPIKGSPYPRNYYRCSTSKGCAARKQVERSPNDQGIFVVSYTGEHTHPRPTHRSSLAGSTRSKPSSNSTAAKISSSSNNNTNNGNLLQKSSISTSSPPASLLAPNTPLMEGEPAAAENDDVEMMAEEEDGGGGDHGEEENIVMISNDMIMNDDDDDGDDFMYKGFQDSDRDLLSSPAPWTPTSSSTNIV